MRLEKYMHFRPTAAMVDIIIKTMVEVISILGIVTKEIRQGKTSIPVIFDITQKADLRTEKFLKKLAGRKDVEDAFQRLDKLTPEEVLMAAAETMAVTRDIDDTVKGVDKRLEGVDERAHRIEINTEHVEDKVEVVHSKVQNVDERVKNVNEGVKDVDGKVRDVDERVKDVDKRVKDVHDRVKVVDGRVGSMIQGRILFPSLASGSVLTPYLVRCKRDRSSDTTGVQSSRQPKP